MDNDISVPAADIIFSGCKIPEVSNCLVKDSAFNTAALAVVTPIPFKKSGAKTVLSYLFLSL